MSIEAEQVIVAACIESAERYDYVADKLTADDFLGPETKLMYILVSGLRNAGRDVDAITLGTILDKTDRWGETQATGGVDYVMALLEVARTFQAVRVYVEILRDARVKRRLLSYASDVTELAHNDDLDSDSKLSEAHSLLNPLTVESGDGFIDYKDAVKSCVQDLLEIYNRGGEISGLPTGFYDLDKMTAGFQPADLIILAGRPSHGKTAFAMNIANFVAKTDPVQVFSLEMSRSALAMRSLSSLGRINLDDLRAARLTDIEDRIVGTQKQMATLQLRIDDRGGISVDQLRTRARVAARKVAPKLIVVDYLTLLAGTGENRTAQVGYVSRSLKALAKELNCPVMCLAQLNRGVDSRPDKRPTLSDLRDSGEIEQDADVVMFSYLHEKYSENTPRKGIQELIIAKQRNGDTGSLFHVWQGEYQQFKNREAGPIPPLEAPGEEKPKRKSRSLASYANGKSSSEEVAF